MESVTGRQCLSRPRLNVWFPTRLFILVALTLPPSHSAADPANEDPRRPFQIRQFVAGAARQMSEASLQPYRVTPFSYGGEPANVLYRLETFSTDGHPIHPAATEKLALPNSVLGVPARPARPRFTIDRWTATEGLPATKIHALHQDHDGYLWVGTVGGLARFDGVRFTHFTEEYTAALRANGSIGRAFFEDTAHRLWIGTERGMLCWEGGQFVEFRGQAGMRGCKVNDLAARAKGGFWFATDREIGFWDGKKITHLAVPGIDQPFCLAQTDPETLWIGGFTGLFHFDVRTGRVSPASTRLTKADGVTGNRIWGMMLDSRKRLWVSGEGAYRLDPQTRSFRRVALENGRGVSVPNESRFAEDSFGRIWATNMPGVGLALLEDEKFGRRASMVTGLVGLAYCLLVDREGAIWIGGAGGLFRLREQVCALVRFDGLGGLDSIRALAQDNDGSLWFANTLCVGQWSGRTVSILDLHLMPRLVPNLARSDAGQMLAGCEDGGWMEIPVLNVNPPPRLKLGPRDQSIGHIQAVHRGPSGTLWIATEEGVYRMNGSSSMERVEPLTRPDVRVLIETKAGELWAGTEAGLVHFNGKRMRTYTTRDGLASDVIYSLLEGKDGTIWIGTKAGLSALWNGRMIHLDAASAVPQGLIGGMVEDADDFLWLNCQGGLCRSATAELESWMSDRTRRPVVAYFGAADGLTAPDVPGTGAQLAVAGHDGRLWFAKRGGLAVVDPHLIPTHTPPPKVLIETMTVNGHALPPDPSTVLPPGSGRDIEIRFATTSLHSPSKVLLQYRLDGRDETWRRAGSLRRAVYANLEPGDYRFRVRARDHLGRWSEREATVAFLIQRHFWRSAPFQWTGGLLLIAAAAGMATRLSAGRVRMRREARAALDRERARIARDLHDHLGPHLSEIALGAHPEDPIRAAAERSSKELRDLIWAVHPECDTLSNLIDFMADFAPRFLRSAKVSLELDIPPERPAIRVAPEVRSAVAAMFKESLHNIARHAHATQVVVSVRWTADQLRVDVRDNGRGFDLGQGAWSRAAMACAISSRAAANWAAAARSIPRREKELGWS